MTGLQMSQAIGLPFMLTLPKDIYLFTFYVVPKLGKPSLSR